MNEREHKPELSEQYLTHLAYFNFIRLAENFGRTPKIENDEPEESKNIKRNMRTLSVSVPAVLESEVAYSISGIDYGFGSNVIEIYYQTGDRATKMMLVRGKKSGVVHVKQTTLFHFDEESHVSTQAPYRNFKPNMAEVCELLKKAEDVLEKQEKEKLVARFDKPKLTIGQRLSRKLKIV